jgi:hypothetical protein
MAGILHMMNAPIGGSSGLAILTDTANVNVANMLTANGWDGISVVHPVVSIGAGARVFSAIAGVPALDTGTLPTGSTVTLINNGAILGRGGDGGAGGDLVPGGGAGPATGKPGGSGSIALKVRVPTTITNNGAIAGGGGGGGGGAMGPGGGGGAGAGLANGGRGGTSSNSSPGLAGANSTLEAPGAGGYMWTQGGNGGFYGSAGGGGASSVTGSYSGGLGGAAGPAVDGDSLVTWSVLGTIYGTRIG